MERNLFCKSSYIPASIGLDDWQSVMNFQPSASGGQRACLPVTDVGDEYIAAWNAWDLTTQDYEFFLYDSSMTEIFGASSVEQNPFAPIEIIPTGPAVGNACLVLASFSSTQNHFFHIDVIHNTINPSNLVREGSISTPADTTGALAVGAVDYTDLLEYFSSSGPTDDGRLEPEICGSDGTLSDQISFNPFFGTSAAAPHVAGAAALMLEEQPSLSLNQLRTKLINDARFNVNFSIDNKCGSNSGMVRLIPLSVPSCLPPQSGDWTITSSCTLPSSTVAPGNVIIQNNSVLTIPNGLTLNIDFTTNHLLIKSGSGVLIKAGGKIF